MFVQLREKLTEKMLRDEEAHREKVRTEEAHRKKELEMFEQEKKLIAKKIEEACLKAGSWAAELRHQFQVSQDVAHMQKIRDWLETDLANSGFKNPRIRLFQENALRINLNWSPVNAPVTLLDLTSLVVVKEELGEAATEAAAEAAKTVAAKAAAKKVGKMKCNVDRCMRKMSIEKNEPDSIGRPGPRCFFHSGTMAQTLQPSLLKRKRDESPRLPSAMKTKREMKKVAPKP